MPATSTPVSTSLASFEVFHRKILSSDASFLESTMLILSVKLLEPRVETPYPERQISG